MNLPAGEYAIIAADAEVFFSDNPLVTKLILDTSMSLGNTGDTVQILDGNGLILDTVTYSSAQGANGDGNSLQRKSNGTWVASSPTPGRGLSGESLPIVETSEKKTETTKTKADQSPHMEAELILTERATTGVPVKISSLILGYSGEKVWNGHFRYVLGDGTVHEETSPREFFHTYQYPGSYLVLFEYRRNSHQPDPDTFVRTTLDVHTSAMTLSVKGDVVELKNEGDIEEDISGWKIQSLSNPSEPYFFIPKGTSVLPGTTIVLPVQMLGFKRNALGSVALLFPDYGVFSIFGPSKKQIPTVSLSPSVQVVPVAPSFQEVEKQEVVGLSANVFDAVPQKGKSLTPFL